MYCSYLIHYIFIILHGIISFEISRVHFELSVVNKTLHLTNKSMNGTFVNGLEVQDPIHVKAGDIISLLNPSFDMLQLL